MLKKIMGILCLVILLACVGVGLYIFHKPHTIAFIGDSITFLGDYNEFGFVKQIRKKLPKNIRIYNEGICGEQIEAIEGRMTSDVIEYKPDVVFIMAGINNINNGNLTLEEMTQEMEKMIDASKENNINPIILNVTLITEDFNNPKNKTVDEFNKNLDNLSKEKQVQLIDVNSLLKEEVKKQNKPDELIVMTDDLHLNDKGNSILANAILKELKRQYAFKWLLLF